ncbi:MAG TPA: Asp-tRNA(Asn)/Glu-tRNA(Gln) amidotransferase GatCAB subunit B, partial [Thiobacillaceae bacterium]|nr:Asp-tRNA(Asn)/Glu-tRNA(Gln) amidotransferase GatCAB subunit B [Thiobacillaceae bacterium]
MRSKEDAHDYRYFPDPDLLPVKLDEGWIEQVKSGLPELPDAMGQRFQRDYGLSAYDAASLTSQREIARFFVDAVAVAGDAQAKTVANWVQGELSASLNREERDITEAPITPAQLAGLVKRIADGTLSNKLAKQVFEVMWTEGGDDPNAADAIIEAKGLKQMSDSGEIERLIDEVLAANAKSVEEFRAGKEKAFNALVGQVMKATKGKANPAQVNDILRGKLSA